MAVFSSHRVHYATIVAHFKITRMYIDKCFFYIKTAAVII